METLNKNWFAFTLIAIIFGCIGYLLGSQDKTHNCPMMKEHHKMIIGKDANDEKSMFMFKSLKDGDIDLIEDIDIETIEVEKGDVGNGEKKFKIRLKTKED